MIRQDVSCPACGHTMVMYEDLYYNCPQCNERVYEEDLPADDSDLTTAWCPNGCGNSEFMWNGTHFVCVNCSNVFTPSEIVETGGEDDEIGLLPGEGLTKAFGICGMCGTTGIFAAVGTLNDEEEEYCCSSCGVVAPIDELVETEIECSTDWGSDKYVGCYSCGSRFKEAEGKMYECAECGAILQRIRNVKRRCDLCNHGDEVDCNGTVHLGAWSQKHHFFCLDCRESFQIAFKTCSVCGDDNCQIADSSLIGYTFFCPTCENEFIDSGSGFGTSAVTPYVGWSWSGYELLGQDPNWTIEDSVKRQFLVVAEI